MKYVSMACLVVLILISSVSCAVGTHADLQTLPEEEVIDTTEEAREEIEDDIDSGLIIISDRLYENKEV